jgi:hypothetical protein
MFELDFLKKCEGIARREGCVGTIDGTPILLVQQYLRGQPGGVGILVVVLMIGSPFGADLLLNLQLFDGTQCGKSGTGKDGGPDVVMDGEAGLLLRAPGAVQSPHISLNSLSLFEKGEGKCKGKGLPFKVLTDPREEAEGMGLTDVMGVFADLKEPCVVGIWLPHKGFPDGCAIDERLPTAARLSHPGQRRRV